MYFRRLIPLKLNTDCEWEKRGSSQIFASSGSPNSDPFLCCVLPRNDRRKSKEDTTTEIPRLQHCPASRLSLPCWVPPVKEGHCNNETGRNPRSTISVYPAPTAAPQAASTARAAGKEKRKERERGREAERDKGTLEHLKQDCCSFVCWIRLVDTDHIRTASKGWTQCALISRIKKHRYRGRSHLSTQQSQSQAEAQSRPQ